MTSPQANLPGCNFLQFCSKNNKLKLLPRVVPPDLRFPVFSVDWAAVGGADLFRSQQVAGPHSEFAEDEAKMVAGLGEMGEPVVLQGREAQLGENIMKTEAFNLIVSDKISYTREVPDTRDMRCQAVQYDTNLPTTSVIIIFTNEAWSPLIRTIWSVLNRSPEHLVKEIILVDDFSDKSHLKGKLERYIHRFLPSKVKLMRLSKREGLIRARLAGARAATGDVILYLDSHCECNTGWLEPLLARIKENPLAFVVPIIDVIDDKTLEYYHGNGNYFQVGGFTWSGHFTWIDISQSELTRRGSPIGATRSPTMAGGKSSLPSCLSSLLTTFPQGCSLWLGRRSGIWEVTTRRWMSGVGRTSRCPSGSGSVAESWRQSPAAESATSSGPSTPTASPGTRTPTASIPPGLWRSGWRSTRGCST